MWFGTHLDLLGTLVEKHCSMITLIFLKRSNIDKSNEAVFLLSFFSLSIHSLSRSLTHSLSHSHLIHSQNLSLFLFSFLLYLLLSLYLSLFDILYCFCIVFLSLSFFLAVNSLALSLSLSISLFSLFHFIIFLCFLIRISFFSFFFSIKFFCISSLSSSHSDRFERGITFVLVKQTFFRILFETFLIHGKKQHHHHLGPR
jgi:hypothetical protein